MIAALNRENRKVQGILVAARRLFLDHGFEIVTMDMVARESGVSKATLYAHFESKESLFQAFVVDEMEMITDEIWSPGPDIADIAEILRGVAQNFVKIFLNDRALLLQRAVTSAVPRFPAVGRIVFEAGPARLTERLSRFFEEAAADGRLRVSDGRLAAIQFISVVRGDIDIRGMLGAPSPTLAEVRDHTEAAIAMFMSHYGPPRPVKACVDLD